MPVEIRADASRFHVSIGRHFALISALTADTIKRNGVVIEEKAKEIQLSVDFSKIQYQEGRPSMADFFTIMAAAENPDADVRYTVADKYIDVLNGSTLKRFKQFIVEEITVKLRPSKGPINMWILDLRYE